ncbi:MAG: UvrD-helicase domain-containing protein, partial [Muribaculaceae bacterium]
MEEYIAKLNDQQREAVLYNEGPSLVIAGAGSGKTRVLTYKIIHLLNLGYDPHRILALTFTNKAAREMKERISQLVGDTTASHLWMGTFHSIFSRILRYNADKI